ncbi:phosphatase PAP2 family protein [Cesiribacter sp. SM1]|uniref:phosphatase PAP2 family protein n=1 Tax=Cesiribacter sp. SM1 TaxID=2861196 RepID=UPI001CD6DE51|nr:phosphatase PAP2 family protein [Cesiribacter sp. SM1]
MNISRSRHTTLMNIYNIPLLWLLLCLHLLLLPVYVAAQDLPAVGYADSSLQRCVVRLPKVPELQLRLPSYITPQFIKTSALAVAGISIWSVTYEHLDEPVREASLRYRPDIATRTADLFEPLGRQKYLAPLAGLAIVSGIAARDEKLRQAGIISMGSILTNAVVTHSLKRAFQRHRPSATDDNDLFDGPLQKTTNTSFPSSHTSTAFTVATSFATVYHLHKYIPPIAYGIASLVGISRIQHNAHWATDVLAGAAVGYLSAKGVSYLYKITNEKLSAKKASFIMLPTMSPDAMGLSLSLTF